MKNDKRRSRSIYIYIKSQTCSRCGVYLGGGKCSDNCIVVEAIKALEQRSVLDKALTEIIDLADANDGNSDCQQWFSQGLWKAVQIINNCKAEIKNYENKNDTKV